MWKRGITSLAIPGHDPPVEITIFCDVDINPGPDRSHFSAKQVLAEHSESLFTSLSPSHTYSRQHILELRRCCGSPCSSTIPFLKFRGRSSWPLFHRVVKFLSILS